MERDRFRHSTSHRGPRDRRPLLLAGAAVGVVALTVAAIAVVRSGDDVDAAAVTLAGGAAAGCAPVDVTTAKSFEPVLTELATTLREAKPCVEVRINVADGRSAANTLRESGTDVWLPDDASWAGVAPRACWRRTPTAGPRSSRRARSTW